VGSRPAWDGMPESNGWKLVYTPQSLDAAVGLRLLRPSMHMVLLMVWSPSRFHGGLGGLLWVAFSMSALMALSTWALLACWPPGLPYLCIRICRHPLFVSITSSRGWFGKLRAGTHGADAYAR